MKISVPHDFLKTTTQDAPLERLLAFFRSQRIGQLVRDKLVLDFGCGTRAWTAKRMRKIARLVHGVDASLLSPMQSIGDINLYQSIDLLPSNNYQIITALAVFEHIPPFELLTILDQLALYSVPEALIFGTVPTPQARPVLELLSFQLGLIDPSQIKDHWVYYDDLWLGEILALSPWKIASYKKFQFGFNSQFVLVKR